MVGMKEVLVALSLACLSVGAAASDMVHPDVFGDALALYENGMYQRARTLFESLGDEPLAQGYAVLCAVKMRAPDYRQVLEDDAFCGRRSIISPSIDYEQALILFDEGSYGEAAAWFAKVPEKRLDKAARPEYAFKYGYTFFARNMYPQAKRYFRREEVLPMSDFRAPARYLLGYMAYAEKDFSEAQHWFERAATDPRFADLASFYLVDCHFMARDYAYVLEKGEACYENAPRERRYHLARILSESYLVTGDKEKARQYYAAYAGEEMTRSDYFYAGSVLYAVEDYAGAIESFCKMPERSDSLGQIANYQLGNAYVRTHNKVAALDAFRDAAAVSYNPDMQEDAWFNYAKLAFDLNQDTQGFTSYIRRYSTSRKGDQIYGYMALSRLQDRDYAGAVEAYDQIDELDDDMQANYIKAYYLRAAQLVESGAYRGAIPCLRAAAYYLPRTDGLGQLARYWQAECLFKTEAYAESAAIYADLYNIAALDGAPEGKLLPYNVAYAHFNQKLYADASRWFDTYLRSGDTRFRRDALLRRADCDFSQKSYQAAIGSYEQAMREIPVGEDVYPYYRQALAYGLSGDKKRKAEALGCVLDASAGDPLYKTALYELGRARMDIGQNRQAVDVFQRLSGDSDVRYRALALIGLGMACRNMRAYDEALAYYKEVVSSMRGTEYADAALAAIESIYQTRGEPEAYLAYVESNKLDALTSDEDRERMYFNAAEQVYLAGEYARAVNSLLAYLEKYPDGAGALDARFYLAESYRNTGEKEKACDAYQAVLQAGLAGPFRESALLQYAGLSSALEKYPQALEAYGLLLAEAKFDENRKLAQVGRMRAAFRARAYEESLAAIGAVDTLPDATEALRTEALYLKAKSCLALSRRDEALAAFGRLAARSDTPEGAEATVFLIQDCFDRGDFSAVQQRVFAFSSQAGAQSYWLAKAYILLADAFVEEGRTAQAKATYESIRDGYVPSGADDDILSLIAAKLAGLENK
ncbi:MAG: tetratricopeptide repeat protein [Bacteroidales bacterium]|nr:tetratricopeptide repeat protein [Bacteroidales bacterium]